MSTTQSPEKFVIPVPEPQLGLHYSMLLDSGEGSDLTLEVDGEQIRAHKLILCARSPVFKAQLMGPLREKSATLRIDDVQAPIFRVSARRESCLRLAFCWSKRLFMTICRTLL